jgi:hypothetical protein
MPAAQLQQLPYTQYSLQAVAFETDRDSSASGGNLVPQQEYTTIIDIFVM